VSLSLRQSVKRLIDIVVSGAALVVLSPLLLALALAVKLTSPGPLFYVCHWVGKGGRRFDGYKFRTMSANAAGMEAELRACNEMTGPAFKMTKDPRVTKLGRLIRPYSLDELPQLWSVLIGDLSLVGPRPPRLHEYERFTEYQKQKLAVKPGITCLWQIEGRHRISDYDQWVARDLEYIRTWSLTLDMKILLLTIPAVLKGTGI
jgi:lipopolysaccharide/colanic/teichoic acid biosynthesis glycosyltransferase